MQGAGSYDGAGTGSAISSEQDAVFSAAIDVAAKADLLQGALTLRQLVRVKLSDEADLKQGLQAVQDTHTLLHNLCRAAHERNMSPFALLQTL